MLNKFTIIIPPQDIACNPDCIKRLANGESNAYEWVYKNYSKKVYDYAMLITRNESMSEDIVQEVFVKLWQNREKLTTVENFNSYLFMLYRNHIFDVLRKQQKEITAQHEYYRDASIPDKTPDDIVSYKETQQVIAGAIKQLPQQRQQVYTLGREYGWSREQIAKELKISPNTVKASMQNSLKFLKNYVLERIEEIPFDQ